MKEYERVVERCRIEDMNLPIYNDSPVHAVVLIRELIKAAKREVLIYTGELKSGVTVTDACDKPVTVDMYADTSIISAAREFLESSRAKLFVLTQGKLSEGVKNPFMAQIKSSRSGLLGEFSVLESTSGALSEYNNHFIVVDRRAYRLETDPNRYKAVANFHDLKRAGRLKSSFDELMSIATSKENSYVKHVC